MENKNKVFTQLGMPGLESTTIRLTLPNAIVVEVTYPFWMRAITLHSIPGLSQVVGFASKVEMNECGTGWKDLTK
jgi:hypothetical protein